MDRIPVVGDIYKHFKGEKYQILAVGVSVDDSNQMMVVYQALFGKKVIWVRKLEEFMDIHPVENVRRFTFIDSNIGGRKNGTGRGNRKVTVE